MTMMMLLLMMMMILLMMIQAQTIAAEAAAVLAENAFVTEKLTKSKVLNYFGWGKKP